MENKKNSPQPPSVANQYARRVLREINTLPQVLPNSAKTQEAPGTSQSETMFPDIRHKAFSKERKTVQFSGKDQPHLFMTCLNLTKMLEPVPRVIKPPVPTTHEYLVVNGLPISTDYSGLLPGELAPSLDNFFQEMENNDAIYREVFERTPNQNMGEILTPITDDYEEPKIDLKELFDLALIKTDEQIYEENYLRHTMALAVFEDKSLEELKELLKNVKIQPL